MLRIKTYDHESFKKLLHQGDLVKAIQRVLKLNQTGSYLKETYQAILNFQKEHELVVDGLIGAETLKQLGNLK